ncbi:son of sevenless homolog 2-like [Schistocerca piceifrons]|uniref:son of sevenless homolog 2-like n=1 Tax=Schistocerca piceifrons TaxID=274613 RepID=UPI001F5F25B8|nr:son of sevenless homolog 2-like [Schistocerca piceifrons]
MATAHGGPDGHPPNRPPRPTDLTFGDLTALVYPLWQGHCKTAAAATHQECPHVGGSGCGLEEERVAVSPLPRGGRLYIYRAARRRPRRSPPCWAVRGRRPSPPGATDAPCHPPPPPPRWH